MHLPRCLLIPLALAATGWVGLAQAKLPAPPLSDEQKAAAEVAKAKAAHQAKVDAYLTCKAAERAAANYFRNHPQAPKPTDAPACNDPGPFVPPAAGGAPASTPAATAPAPAKKS
ncbi:MAG: hypothetical protein AB1371_02270 [Pseudomonadota bacterium]